MQHGGHEGHEDKIGKRSFVFFVFFVCVVLSFLYRVGAIVLNTGFPSSSL